MPDLPQVFQGERRHEIARRIAIDTRSQSAISDQDVRDLVNDLWVIAGAFCRRIART